MTTLLGIVLVGSTGLQAQTFTLLHSFTSGGNGANPSNPGIITQGKDGNLYSTTLLGCGGFNLFGEVFRSSPTGTFKTVLCLNNPTYNNLGGPYSGVTMGTDGNFYGTSIGGDFYGSLWKVSSAGKLTVFSVFNKEPNIFGPTAPPVLGMDGNWYGTAVSGGTGCTYGSGGCGGIYKVSSAGKSYKILHTFAGTDGANSNTPLLLGSDGNFYGTTAAGGTGLGFQFGPGVIFKMTPSGTYTVLYDFCTKTSCVDGGLAYGALAEGADGDYYGTASTGGTRTYAGASPGGVVFKVSSLGVYSVLYNFCSQPSCTDGNTPYGGLVLGSDGNFYGTTFYGGAHNFGTIFQVTPTGALTVLYNFDSTTGAYPETALAQHTNGELYGDTHSGGASNAGTFYSLNMSLPTFAKLVTWWGKPGGAVQILGQGFKTATSVAFNGTAATFKIVNDTSLTATVPVGATSGSVTITTSKGTLTSSQSFEVK